MRKVEVIVKVKLSLEMEEGVEVCEVISDLDYNFTSNTPSADIADMDIQDYEVTDSR